MDSAFCEGKFHPTVRPKSVTARTDNKTQRRDISVTMAATEKVLVKALYAYKGLNTDELNFRKGDVITVTQQLDGGWWEGTLGDLTGWFPSNYVREVHADRAARAGRADGPKRESMRGYHNIVLQNIVETDRAYVGELEVAVDGYLAPLRNANMLPADDYTCLCGNVEEIVAFQKAFDAALEACSHFAYEQQRAGGTFLNVARAFHDLYVAYCANHPRAVQVLARHRDALDGFAESRGATPPGAMALTTSLSLPFRRLARYPIMLKELERQVEEDHVDRGDIQRSIAVYQEILDECECIRRQKDLELEALTGTIRGWEGKPIAAFGELLLMRNVAVVSPPGGERKERCFLLFSDTLVMLSSSPRMSAYIYEGQVQLVGITVRKLEDTDALKHTLELYGPLIEKMLVACASPREQTLWHDTLLQQISASAGAAGRHAVPTVTTTAPRAATAVAETSKPQPRAAIPLPFPPASPGPFPAIPRAWNISRLRPAAPARPQPPSARSREEVASPRVGRRAPSPRRRGAQRDERATAGDQVVLQVIEAYCTSAKARYTVNSTLLDAPQVLIAEDEKIIVEETKGDRIVVEERSLVDTVYALKDKVGALEAAVRGVRRSMEEERRARRRLETLLRKSVRSLVEINFDESQTQATL
ncbi:PREDICTED: rho guanine nucleotide exchange factor 7-like [Priapulus caudatus]|uniref:Rho guanine nucleotide exchange factor 7-like n=1 Tax=Priapulus caudatus TaxID=37621 RepID=A0ABM1FBW3_PRICU|nr:PREDICTED: rho guanine nucleotide exchange factor 7-like [Priapulus caudatus]